MDPNLSHRPSSKPFKMLKYGINGNGNHARYLYKRRIQVEKERHKKWNVWDLRSTRFLLLFCVIFKTSKIKEDTFQWGALITTRMNQALKLIAQIKSLFSKWSLNNLFHNLTNNPAMEWHQKKIQKNKGKNRWNDVDDDDLSFASQRDTPYLIVPNILGWNTRIRK